MLSSFQAGTVPVGSTKKEENPELVERGGCVEKRLPESCEAYAELVERATAK